MKYWFFNGSDVLGPFTPKELAANKAFCATSLVCPENFSNDGDHWQLASTFEELARFLLPSPDLADEDTITLDQELDTLLHEKSPLAFDGPTTDGPGLQLPAKPAKPGPIEDYFDHIEKEDLGDILGIPAPNENSDMDLAHALEKQLAKTSSTRRRERAEQETASADEQTAQALEQNTELSQAQETHHIATATEVFATKAPLAEPPLATPPATTKLPNPAVMPTVDFPTMPTVEPLVTPPQQVPVQAQTPTPALPVQEQPNKQEPEDLLAPKTQDPVVTPQEEISRSEAAVPATPEEAVAPVPDPAQLRREKIEVNSINARLKQTQEMKDLVHHTRQKQLKKESRGKQKIWVALLALSTIIGGLLAARSWQPAAPSVQSIPVVQTPTNTAQELLPAAPAVMPPVPKTPLPAAPATQEQQALSIVKNYPLSGNRGPLAAYLNHIYQSQLSQGYTAAWDAEALHKNTYLVKYRLTKTRKEPIIYIFQADVAQGKLTGALNNISLDLVGKI